MEAAGGRAFCAGGDIRAIRDDAVAGNAAGVHRFFAEEYALDLRIARFPKPCVALIDEVKAWAAANRTALDGDWKGFSRLLHQFGDRWRDRGHVGEKVFAELQGPVVVPGSLAFVDLHPRKIHAAPPLFLAQEIRPCQEKIS